MSLPLALILEDDPKLAELYEMVLKQCQYETVTIESGREAQKSLDMFSPVLILLDIHLPYVSGTDLLEQIQADERFKGTTTIVITADLYTAKDLEGKVEHVLLKTHGITRLRDIATRVHPGQ
jgi:two-component system, cell cycle response regulator DivK